jgi:hypothetical protein
MGRIPIPWRLQLAMPEPCKHFFRMNVYRNTLINEITDAAEQQCKLKKGCLLLIDSDNNNIIESQATAESCNLFNINKVLKIDNRDICLHD